MLLARSAHFQSRSDFHEVKTVDVNARVYNERNKNIVTDEIKQGMQKGRTGNDTGEGRGREDGGFALYDGLLFLYLCYHDLTRYIIRSLRNDVLIVGLKD